MNHMFESCYEEEDLKAIPIKVNAQVFGTIKRIYNRIISSYQRIVLDKL